MHSLYPCAQTKLTYRSQKGATDDLPRTLIATTEAVNLNIPKTILLNLTTKTKEHFYHSSSLFCLAQLSTVAKLNKMDSGYN